MPGESSQALCSRFCSLVLHNRGAGTDCKQQGCVLVPISAEADTAHTWRSIPDDHVTYAESGAINLVPDSSLPPSSSPAPLLKAGTETSGVSALQDSPSRAQSKSWLRGLNAWGTEQYQHLVHLRACSQPPVHSPRKGPYHLLPTSTGPRF